jgi:membrane protease YdiL (CAAX protease family)
MTKILALLRGKNILAFCVMFLVMIGIINGIHLSAILLGLKLTSWQSFLWTYLLQNGVLLLLVYFWFYRRFPAEREQISWSGSGLSSIIKYVLLLFASYFAFVILLNVIKNIFHLDIIPGMGEQISLIEIVGMGPGLWIAFFAAVIIAPIVEEYVFRGWGMICLPLASRPFLSILINGVLFALFHFELSVIIPLIFLGCMLAWTRYKSGSILPGIVFHLINNSLALYVDYVNHLPS